MAENNEEKKVNTSKEDTKQTSEKEVKKETKKEPAKKQTKKVEEAKKETVKAENEKKDDTTFKKVENQNVKKKSNHRILKTILILIGILVIVYFVFVIRNYIILNQICEKAEEYKNVTNYTYRSKIETTELTVYVKGNVSRVDIDNLEDDSKDITIWTDKYLKETILAFPNQKTATKNSVSSVVATAPFEVAQSDYLIMSSMLYARITTEEFDGKDCYVVHIDSDYILWVEKDTGLVVKRQTGDSVAEYTNIGINNVDEIYKPDLTGYTVSEEE